MRIAFLDTASLGPGLDFRAFDSWGDVVHFDNTAYTERAERLQGVTVAVANRVVFDAELLAQTPHLKLILLTATGYNNVDLDAARRHGIGVCNVVGYSTESVAQHTLAILLALMEQTAFLDAHGKARWAGSTTFEHLGRPFHEISGRTWGIIGLGQIGKRVAFLAEAFGARVQYFSTSGVARDDRWPRVSLADLLASSDIVSIHSPFSPATKGLIGAAELASMRDGAYLVNVGRGGIVDEAALAEMLNSGKLGGAALDVTLPEPPLPENPLLCLREPQRLILSPHVAWASVESRTRCLREVELNLRAWTQGERRNRLE